MTLSSRTFQSRLAKPGSPSSFQTTSAFHPLPGLTCSQTVLEPARLSYSSVSDVHILHKDEILVLLQDQDTLTQPAFICLTSISRAPLKWSQVAMLYPPLILALLYLFPYPSDKTLMNGEEEMKEG